MLKRFLDYLRFELNRAPLTITAYENDISSFISWLSPSDPQLIDFKSVTSSDIRTWLSSLARTGDSPRTIRRKIISLRSFYKWMMKSGLVDSSPLNEIVLPKISKPLPEIIKDEEIESAITDLSPDETLREENPKKYLKLALQKILVEMLYSLGIRRAELAGINDEDISFTKGEIKVTGKRSKQRVIPVPQKLLSQIREWQSLRNSFYNTDSAVTPLFIIKGKRINVDQIYNLVKDAMANVSARKKSPHALRHSFASGMLNEGADIDAVREFLGHASLSTTQIYTHISFNEIKKAYEGAHPRSVRHDVDGSS